MSLSNHRRWEIIFLLKHPHGPKWSQRKVSKYLGIDRKTIRKWVKRYEETGDVQDLEGRGRNRKTLDKIDKKILKLFENDTTMSLSRACAILERKNIHLSIATISRRLHEAGFSQKVPLSKPLLSPDHVEQRLEWCSQMAEIDWNKVIFSDESSFVLKGLKKKYWSRDVHRKIFRVVKHPQKIHVWGCFCSKGFGKVYIFKENLTAAGMVKIYNRALLPSITMFGFDKDNGWLFQEDNDPKHTSNLAKEWKLKKNIPKLEWPVNSPDLSPIENIWGIMKTKIAEKNPKNIRQLVRLIRKTWKKFPEELAQNLVNSMINRIEDCKIAKGDYILY